MLASPTTLVSDHSLLTPAMRHALRLLTAVCGCLLVADCPVAFGCTIFVAARGGSVLTGNNEDNAALFNPDTRIWFLPPAAGRFGIAFFGYGDGVPQGGMNDHGLFFDGAALPNGAQCLLGDRSGGMAVVEFKPDQPTALGPGEGDQLIDSMMSGCETVEAALKVLTGRFRAKGISHHVVRPGGDFQVATNFPLSTTRREKITCKRYEAATKMLAESPAISVDLFRSILQAAHQEGPFRTFYSTICDLKQGVVYLYQNGQFDHVVKLRLADELSKGKHELKLSACFK